MRDKRRWALERVLFALAGTMTVVSVICENDIRAKEVAV
jgi:hypothetical protein